MIKIIKAADAAGLTEAKPLALKKRKGETKYSNTKTPEAAKAKVAAIRAAEALAEKGVVGRASREESLSSEDMLHQYITLDSIGAPSETIRAILKVSTGTLQNLRRQSREMYVASLSDMGVMGTIGTAFHRIDIASKRAMAVLATMNDNDPKTLDAARALVSFETQKVELLVRTGAVKVKHRIEVSNEFEPDGAGDPSLMSGASAMRILQMLQLQDGQYVGDIQDASPR